MYVEMYTLMCIFLLACICRYVCRCTRVYIYDMGLCAYVHSVHVNVYVQQKQWSCKSLLFKLTPLKCVFVQTVMYACMVSFNRPPTSKKNRERARERDRERERETERDRERQRERERYRERERETTPQGGQPATHQPQQATPQQATHGGSGGPPPGDPRRRRATSSVAAQEAVGDAKEWRASSTFGSSVWDGGPKPQTMPPELPINPDDYLHMRSLGYGGAWAAVIMHRTDGREPAYFTGQDRQFARARQGRKQGAEGHTGHLATGTAMVLFPIGAPGTRWLLFVTAVERCNDPRATKLAPGEAFILSRPKGAKQWEHRRVLGPAAQQYFADWRREWTVGRQTASGGLQHSLCLGARRGAREADLPEDEDEDPDSQRGQDENDDGDHSHLMQTQLGGPPVAEM